MDLILVKYQGDTQLVLRCNSIDKAKRHIKNGYPAILPYINDVVFEQVVGNKEDFPTIPTLTGMITEAKLEQELANVELDAARAVMWLIKLLIQKGTLSVDDIPDKLIELRDRIDDINSQLGR